MDIRLKINIKKFETPVMKDEIFNDKIIREWVDNKMQNICGIIKKIVDRYVRNDTADESIINSIVQIFLPTIILYTFYIYTIFFYIYLCVQIYYSCAVEFIVICYISKLV